MNKLLTEQELINAIQQVFDEERIPYEGIHEVKAANKITALVQSQKLAHGEMVIGKDWDGSQHPERGGYNAAKAEARERNK